MSQSPLTLQSRVRWSRDHLAAEVAGEVVLMSIERGSYYGLDGVGSGVWRRLAAPTVVADLCQALSELYEADRATLDRDVLSFLQSLAAEGLVEIAPAD